MIKQKRNETQQAYLKRLQLHWYKKLASKGFKDAEDSQGRLRNWDSYNFVQKRHLHGQFEAKEQYFSLAREMLSSRRFKSAQHKRIWALHTDGLSTYEIAAKLRIGRSNIHKIIVYYRQLMLKPPRKQTDREHYSSLLQPGHG